MDLTNFRIRMYKGILDSNWVEVNNLTVLVGKNESGKTSLLKALYKLNPYASDPYEMDQEWPRGRLDACDPEHVVCQAEFRLSEPEKSELARIASIEKIPDVVIASRNYAGDLNVKFKEKIFSDEACPIEIDPAKMDALLETLPKVGSTLSNEFKKCAQACLAEVRDVIRHKEFDVLGELVQKHKSALQEKRVQSRNDPYRIEGQFIKEYLERLPQLAQELQPFSATQSQVDDYLQSSLPKFIYMDDYRIFTGAAQLNEIKARRDADSLTEEDRTFATILSLSGLNLDQLVEPKEDDTEAIKKRQNALAGGSRSLTRTIANRLSQRDYEIDYRVDGQHFFTNVKDSHDPTAVELEERSRGFQWFFSFDLMLMHETKGALKGCVILLDEPGLHLHPEAQQDLLHRLEKYAAANTLIYTTHLPFMIDLNHPSRIRILEERDHQIVVTTHLTESNPKAKLVLQSALGMNASQSFLVAERNLVVEGIHDYWILTELSNLLRRTGKKGLPEDVFITPSSSASEAIPIVNLMIGQNLDVIALFDSDRDGRVAKDKLVDNWFLLYQKKSHTDAILLGDAVGASGDFAIEDLFTDDFYVEIVKETYSKELSMAPVTQITLSDKGMLWKRVDSFLRKQGIKKPNKGSVAKRLQDKLSQMQDTSELPDETQQKVTKLFQTIRKTLGDE